MPNYVPFVPAAAEKYAVFWSSPPAFLINAGSPKTLLESFQASETAAFQQQNVVDAIF